MNKEIKKGNLNYDQSGRAYPDNPQIKENWDCIWEFEGKHYKLVGDDEHKEWEIDLGEMNNLDKQYTTLLQDILDNGVTKQTRNGGTLSVFGRQIRHKMSEGFPLLTTKKLHWRSIVTELLWFLQGRTDLRWLLEQGNTIWVGDAYKNYVQKCNEDKWMKEIVLDLPFPNKSYGLFTQEEFINKIKTDDEFAKKWGELGPIYGKQWRDWKGFHEGQHDILKVVYGTEGREHYLVGIDQIANLINDLKNNPDSRRLMVNVWNVGELDQMVLPPCHYGFQVYTRELSIKERCDAYMKWSNDPKCAEWKNHIENEMGWDYEKPAWVFKEVGEQLDKAQFPTRAISLMWNQRSVDTFLGLPFNIASYGLLLEIIAKEVNMVPDELIGNLGDVHLYSNHIEQAKEQIGREPFGLPTLDIHPGMLDYDMEKYEIGLFNIKNYQSHPTIKAPLSN